MKHIKRLLASVLAAAMAVSLAAPPVLAAPDESARPSIANPTASGYKGGIVEINWGGTDWGAFKDVNFTGAMDKTADELAVLFDGTEVNVIKTDSTLTFEAEEGEFYTDADVNLDVLDYGAGEINFPVGDTVIISSAKDALYLSGETRINIPDNSSVLIINTYKIPESWDEDDKSAASCVEGDTVNINTNASGNLAVLGFGSGTATGYGLHTKSLNVSGTGVVAALGGRAMFNSIGIYAAHSIHARGVTLIGAGASDDVYCVSGGIKMAYAANQEDAADAGILSAEDNALVIGAGGESTTRSYGISTSDTEALDHSEIYAYGGMAEVTSEGLEPCIIGARPCVITADNGSKIIAGGAGEEGLGIFENYYSDPENPELEYNKFGTVRFLMDESENAEPSEIYVFGSDKPYFQANKKEQTPGGNVKILGSDELDGSFTNVVTFDGEKHTYTYNGQIAKILQITKGETADYTLYYNPADSSFYKSYDVLEDVYSDKVDSVTGASGDGRNLTLTSDFKFYTSADVGLALPELTNIIVPEGEEPEIIAGSLTDGTATAGITSFSGCYMNIEGTLYVSGGYGNNKNSYGIFGYDLIFISGNGAMVCSGGSVNADNGDSYYSIGIYTPSVLSVSKTMVIADGGRIFADDENSTGESIGILTGPLEGSPDEDEGYNGVSVSEQAYVLASGNGGSGNVFSYGCITSSVWVNGDSDFMLNTYGNSKSAVGLGILLDKYAEVIVGDNGWIGASAEGGEVSVAMSEVLHEDAEFDGTKQITLSLSGNGSIHLQGETQAVCATRKPFGSVKVTDGTNELTYSEDAYGYVNSDGTPAARVQIEAVPTADYTIYYSQDTGFRKNGPEGEQLTADTLPEGMSAEGYKITLDNVEFITSSSIAFMTEGDVTIQIPENSRAGLLASPDDPEADYAYGIEMMDGGIISADGFLGVQAVCPNRTVGIASFDQLVMDGGGEIISRELFGGEGSYAIFSTNRMIIGDSVHVYPEAISSDDTLENISGTISQELCVWNDAVLDTRGGLNSSAITIWDGGNIWSTDNTSIIADGGIVMFGNEEKKPGEIKANDESTIEVICDHEGDGNSVLDWGICGIPNERSDAPETETADIAAEENAKIIVTSPAEAEHGGAVYRAKAYADVIVTGGKTAEDSGDIEYKGETYVLPGTENTAKYAMFTGVEEVLPDYAIYYDAEAGFRKNKPDGDPLTADELPEGISADGNTLTLKNFVFSTTASVALAVGDGVTVSVPEEEYVFISCHGEDEGYGLEFLGNGVLRVDGYLYVSASGSEAYGIAAFGDLAITGAGELSADEYSDSDTAYVLFSTDNITVDGSIKVDANAYSLIDAPKYVYSVICRQLNVKDSASLEAWGDNSSGIGIWDGGDIIVENSASITAYGGIVLFGNEEKKPGAIRASGDSTVTVICEHEGEGTEESENVLDWGITGAPDKENASADAIADIIVTDNAAVSVSVAAENGGAVYKAKAAKRVIVTGGNTADESAALEYKDDKYVLPGTDDAANYILFKGVKTEPVDYTICYSAETGFRKNKFSGDPITADELPEGISADGNTLTLDNVEFITTSPTALAVKDGVTIYVPENTSSKISAVNGDPDEKSVYALEFDGNSAIRADGSLLVSAEGADLAIAIGAWGDLTIAGGGEVTAEERGLSKTSYALLCTDNLVIKDSVQVYADAYAPNGPSELTVGVICRQLNVKDDAYLDTSGGEGAMGIWIWDGYDMVAEDNARINAYGGIIMEGETDIDPGAIRASGESIIMVVSFREGDGNSVLYWGICGIRSDNPALIYVNDNARVLAYSIEENGGAVTMAKAVDGVSVIGGNSAAESGALEYKDETYVLAGTDDTANFIVFRSAEKEIVDYPLYFDGETGKLYKTFDYTFGEGDVTFSDPVEVPGVICEKNKLTLTSEFQFYTTYEDGLILGEGTTLYVPEGESPSVHSAVSGLVLNENTGGTSGITCLGNNTLNIDGSLSVIAGDGVNIDSWGITDAGVGKNMDITGKGSLTVYGGNITYDETVPEDRPRGVSCAIGAYDDINVSIAELNAIGGNAYLGSFGIVADYPDTEPHTLTVSGGSHVTARGGRCDNEEMCLSVGGAANHLVIKDNSNVTLYAPGAGEKYYAIGLLVYNNNENYGEGKIELSDNSTLKVKAGDTSSSCGIVPSGELEPISASMDKGCTFTAEGAYKASVIEVKGVSAVSDGKTVKYDSEQISYVDEDGNPVTQISFEPLAAEPTTAPKPQSGASGGFKPSSSGSKPAATSAPDATSAPEATAAPDATTAPSATQQPESTNAPSADNFPFIDVKPIDWFYNAVKAAYTEGLINGVTETEFAPNMTLTRGMLVTIIGRMGAAETSASSPFTDVDVNAYYAPYVAWAAENGIVTGFGGGIFKPDETVTREQTAAILYRYMKYIGADVSVGENTNILSFTDASAISEYAIPAIQWACGAGIINGYPNGSLAPQNGITRAEFASIISAVSLN